MEQVFWISALFVAYIYAGYPLVLAAWSRLRPAATPTPRPGDPMPPLPYLSVVVAVRNEAARLPGRLENLLSQDYPPDRFEVIVVSDGSSDGTERIAERYAPRVRTVRRAPGGKAEALNAGVREARHALLVFADARQRFAPDALRRLAAPFADPRVGGVSGELFFAPAHDQGETGVGEGVGAYWAYEKWIRRHESAVGSLVGATGAIYALRRCAWKDLPPQTILDDVLAPMRAVLMGFRVVFEPAARAFDDPPGDAAAERRRKVRTLAGNYQLIGLEPRLLAPGFNPVWLQFVSHKLGRLLVPYALVGLLVSSASLASAGALFGVALVLQVAFYLLALHGATLVTRTARPSGGRVTPANHAGVARRGVDTDAGRARKEWMNASLD